MPKNVENTQRLSLIKCTHFETIYFYLDQNFIEVHTESIDGQDLCLKYQKKDSNQCVIEKLSIDLSENDGKIVVDKDFCETVIGDFAIIVENPNFSVRELVFDGKEKDEKIIGPKFLEIFKRKIPHKIHVKEISLQLAVNQHEILDVFRFIKPENLERITVKNDSPSIDKLPDTEQWKSAGYLRIGDVDLSARAFMHFDWCYVGKMMIGLEDLEVLVQTILQKGERFVQFSYEPIQPNGNLIVAEFLEKYENKEPTQHFGGYQIKIPGTRYHLNIDNGTFRVMFRKLESTVFGLS